MQHLTALYLYGSLALLVLSIWAIRVSFRRGSFFTGVNGINFMVLMFMGIGPLCYGTVDLDTAKVIQTSEVITYYEMVLPFFLVGYLISIFIQIRFFKKNVHSTSPADIQPGKSLFRVLFIFFLALIGYFLTQSEIGASGLGTAFPLMRKLLYPAIILSIYLALSTKQTPFVITALIVSLIGFYFAFISVWRNELIMISASVGLGFLLFSRKYVPYLVLFGILGVVYVLPFQQLKKFQYSNIQGNLFQSFLLSMESPLDQKLTFSAYFFAERINYGREIAFIQHAVEKEWIRLRNGETYIETVQQLIPRVLWPDKPSFNTYINIVVPRQIGLVAEENVVTAWGVNCFAEFIYNFDYIFLIIFVPLLTLLFVGLDLLVHIVFVSTFMRFICSVTLFFTVFEMVSLLFVSTYLIWIFILLKILETIFRLRTKRAR